jgi:hypothetical protein
MEGENPPEVQNLAGVLSVCQSDRPENLRSTVMEGDVVTGGAAFLPLCSEHTTSFGSNNVSQHVKICMNDT